MNLINALRNFMGLPPVGTPIEAKEPYHLSRNAQVRKEKARKANKLARNARRAQRLTVH